jgi:hypothetical protein
MNKKTKTVLIIVSVIIFLISLFSYCYIADGEKDTIGSFGLIAFLLGWANVSDSWITRFANPFFLLTIIMLYVNRVAAAITASIAFALALSFQIFDEVLINEAGTTAKIDSFAIGYWFWLASICIIFIASLFNLKTSANTR